MDPVVVLGLAKLIFLFIACPIAFFYLLGMKGYRPLAVLPVVAMLVTWMWPA